MRTSGHFTVSDASGDDESPGHPQFKRHTSRLPGFSQRQIPVQSTVSQGPSSADIRAMMDMMSQGFGSVKADGKADIGGSGDQVKGVQIEVGGLGDKVDGVQTRVECSDQS